MKAKSNIKVTIRAIRIIARLPEDVLTKFCSCRMRNGSTDIIMIREVKLVSASVTMPWPA